MKNNECVVLLHGIMRSNKQMNSLKKALQKHNYKVLNVDYPSTKYDILSLSEMIWKQIQNEFTHQKVHIIGYSMGGIIAKTIIDMHKPTSLGKVILIGTPYKGSEVADFFQNYFLYKKIFGPSGQQLTTNQRLISINQDVENYELGCIASNLNGIWKAAYPVSYFIMKKANDGRVSLESTMVHGMKEHIVISCPHFFMPYSSFVKSYVLSFLKFGHFINQEDLR